MTTVIIYRLANVNLIYIYIYTEKLKAAAASQEGRKISNLVNYHVKV